MIKISQAKKIRRDTCLAVGHDNTLMSGFVSMCKRCKKKDTTLLKFLNDITSSHWLFGDVFPL